MPQATHRITDKTGQRFNEAAAEMKLFRSDIFRQALVHYIDTNLDLVAFDRWDSPSRRTVESRKNTDDLESPRAADDPTTNP